MAEALQTGLLSPRDAAEQSSRAAAPNGLRFGTLGRLDGPYASIGDLQRLVGVVPAGVVQGLQRYRYLFVPLALSGARLLGDDAPSLAAPDDTLIAPEYSPALAEKAICHRNAQVGDTETVFLSSRLHNDRFALAFEFCINVAHNFVDGNPPPAEFGDLLWRQATTGVRGETSIDAWEDRAAALGQPLRGAPATFAAPTSQASYGDERARSDYQATAFADTLAIYLLSMTVDFDYADLREREYPLLAAPALAERLRAVNRLYPANNGYQFQILYRRRS